jgi:hypothetical protein
MSDSDQSPVVFTTNPRLSVALHGSGADLERAMEEVGAEQVLTWLRNRVGEEIDPDDLQPAVEAWFAVESPEDRTLVRAELAELIGDADLAVTELLWDASLRDGYARDDSEQAFDAVATLARIAEESGDPLAAAEYYVEFLNWRREAGHASDPEAVHQAFEEVERLAGLEHQAAVAARYSHAHAVFTRAEDDDHETAYEGDWAPGSPPYTGWE